jgi:hypothetical protein
VDPGEPGEDGILLDHFPEEDDFGDIIADMAADEQAQAVATDAQSPIDRASPAPRPPLPPPVIAGDAAPRVVMHPAAGRAARTAWNRIDHPSGNGYLRLSQTRGCAHWDIRAVCNKHGCTLTRHGDKGGLPPGSSAGRPIGEQWHFLTVAHEHATKAIHRDGIPRYSIASRLAARQAFSLIEGSALFFDKERPRRTREGEGLEPVHMG